MADKPDSRTPHRLDPDFLNRSGHLGNLISARNWAASPLGPFPDWSRELRGIVRFLLHSKFPMFLLWGVERVLIYNDAYGPILGQKHPDALGRAFFDVWPEVRAEIEPIIDRAFAGKASFFEDLPVDLERDGYPERTYFTFSYSPVHDESGAIAGVFCTCTETSGKVIAQERHAFQLGLESRLRGLSDPLDIISAAQEELGRYLSASRVGYGEVDETARFFTTAGNWTDGTVAHSAGTRDLASFGSDILGTLRRGETLVVHDIRSDPRTNTPESLAALVSVETAAALTASLVKNGRMIAALYVHSRLPRRWTENEVKLVEDVAARTWSAIERARADSARRAAEARIGNVLQSMAEGFVLLDSNFRVVEINAEGLRMERRAACDLIGKTHWEAWPGSEDSELGLEYKRAMMEREPVSLDHRYVFPDGREIWLEMRAYPSDEGLALFYRDVTERKRAELALRESEDHYRHTVELNPQVPWTAAPDGQLDHVARRWFDWTGTSGLGSTWGEAIHPDDLGPTVEAWTRSVETGDAYDIEHRVHVRGGAYHWMRSRAFPRWDAQRRITKWYGTTEDINERKAAEERLRVAQRAGGVGTFELFPATGRIVVSDQFCRLWGVPDQHEMNVHDLLALIHPDDQERVMTGRPALPEHALDYIEYRILRGDTGELRWLARQGEPVPNQATGETRYLGVSYDITGRKRAEDALRQLNDTLESQVAERTAERDRIWRLSRDLLVVIGGDGTFRAVSPAWKTILGHEPHHVVGSSFLDFIYPEDAVLTQGRLTTAASKADLTDFENRYLHVDGSYRWISWHTSREGDLVYAYGRDITAEKTQTEALRQAEEALRHAQKMEAVGQLTGGIAHDFNNMLAVVIGSLDLLGRRIAVGDARARRYVDAATDGARRAALLTQRLLAFSRQQPLRPEPIDANKLVAGMSNLLRHSLGSDVRLETVLARGLWRTHADPNQLENVILNLAINARDAMPDGGRLTIETQNAQLDHGYVAAHIGLAAGPYVLITVTDTGSGMPPEVIAKAFDPFFTTKEVGKGTGLGLSQVYGFVKQSGGHVKIESEPGQGTIVKVYVPRLLGSPDESPEEKGGSMPALGDRHELVLVVEDEPAVRQFSVDALSELGYRVLEADGAPAALRLIEAHPGIALIFTDIVMPEVNGRKLADEARRQRPHLKVLFTTGYTRDAVIHNGALEPGVELIAKPFTIEELAAKVREVLDAPVPAVR